jgi:hypothetical protein
LEEALAAGAELDRALVSEMLEIARALKIALVDACRTNLELKSMDRNVASASNKLRDAIEALNRAYTAAVQVDETELENLVEQQITIGRNLLKSRY